MGENLSIQQKIVQWLNAHPEYKTKTENEIISAMLSDEDNNLTLSELEEISLFTGIQTPTGESLSLEKTAK